MKKIAQMLMLQLLFGVFVLRFACAQQAPTVTSFSNITNNSSCIILGNHIALKVSNIDSLMSLQNDTGTLMLFIDGIAMTGIKANSVNLDSGIVNFTISRSDDNDPWDAFYVSPLPKNWRKSVRLSVGYQQTGAIYSQVNNIVLIIIRRGYFWIAILCILFILALFYYANKRGLLKDKSNQILIDKPYSLGRTQLAIWTLIVSISYIFIALVTGELAPLSNSTLLLLGISSATTLAAGMIDTNDILNNKVRTQNADKCQGFITDILSDENGVSTHRFQMVVFNVILGVFFIKQVFSQLQMPDFDNNLLLLMGISNFTYAGIKINENNTPPNNTPPNSNTPSGNNETPNNNIPANSDTPPANSDNPPNNM